MRPGRLLHDLRSRALVNVLLFTLSTTAVLTGVLGPLLLAAITQSSLRSALQTASVDETSVTVVLAEVQGDLGGAPDEVAAVFTPTVTSRAARFWTAPQVWTESTDNLPWAPKPREGRLEAVSRVHVLDARCTGLRLVTGRCPTKRGEVLLSVRDARHRGLHVGSQVSYRVPVDPERQGRVVGTYNSADTSAPLTRPAPKRSARRR